jgi:hypothetical protein
MDRVHDRNARLTAMSSDHRGRSQMHPAPRQRCERARAEPAHETGGAHSEARRWHPHRTCRPSVAAEWHAPRSLAPPPAASAATEVAAAAVEVEAARPLGLRRPLLAQMMAAGQASQPGRCRLSNAPSRRQAVSPPQQARRPSRRPSTGGGRKRRRAYPVRQRRAAQPSPA